jgi:hypothetical protein
VDALFWAALGFLVIAIVVGAAYVGVRAWRVWQACVSLALVGAAGADLLTARGELAAAKAEQLEGKVDDLLTALARLQRSTARGRVLLDAVQEMLSVVRTVLAYMPK